MQVGRVQSKAVRDYLNALVEHKPKRGRKRTPDSVRKQLAEIDSSLGAADPMDTLQLLSRRERLEAELNSFGAPVDLGAVEAEFVKVAKAYGERNDITYSAWRSVGVSAVTLKAAGIGRGA